MTPWVRITRLARPTLLLWGLVGLLGAPLAGQQTGRISGRVTDKASGAGIGEVQVYLQGEGIGALSRQDGRFLILNVAVGNHTLVGERIGLGRVSASVSVTAGAIAEANLVMESQALGLDEIVVTGTAGAARRREVGNTIAQINVAALPDRPVHATDMLQSAAPGIQVTSVGGGIGQGKRIVLRGNSSVSMSNQPIIYVDGIRMMSGAFPQTTAREYKPGRGANVTVSPLDNLNPNDIERIEVIKGAAATTLYGTEASAGVIQIFTKRGSTGAPVWSLETQQGMGWSRRFGVEPEPYNRIEPWLSNAYQHEYFSSVTGGSPAMQYFLSGQLDREDGLLPNDRLNKYVVRGNFNFTPASDLQLQFNTTYVNHWQKNTPDGNNAHGLTLNAFRGERNYFGTNDFATLSQVLTYDLQQWIERFTTGGTATFSPLPSLSNRLTIGYDYAQQEARNLRPYGFAQFPQGALQSNVFQKRILTVDYVGSLTFPLTSAVRSSFSWGGQAIGDDQRELEGWGEGFPGAANPTVSSAAIKIAEEKRQKVWNAGFFLQNVFDVHNRYFVTLGMRVDGNSAFGSGFGLQMYPKASLSWVLSDEGFWQEGWGQMKLRAAYGESGRAPGAFDAVRTWSQPGLAGRPAFVPQNVGNPDLGPEVTKEIEFGFDGSWLSDRVRATFTSYNQHTTKALFQVAQVQSRGFGGNQLLNVGEIKNAGLEIELMTTPIQRGSWGLDVGASLATNRSEALDLGGAREFQALNGWIIKGEPIPVLRGKFVTNPDAIAAPVIVENHLYGPQLPTRTVNASTTLRLPRGVSVSARGEYRGGNKMSVNPMSVERSVRSPLCYPYYKYDQGIVSAGPPFVTNIDLKPETPAIWRARCTPALYDGAFYNWNADYFKLRSVSATLPLDFAFPDRVSTSTLTLALTNSWLWMKEIPWGDPELLGNEGVNSAGLGQTERVPAPINFRASVRLTF